MFETGSPLSIGSAVLDPERSVLRRADGTETTLRPKTQQLLLLLLRKQGRLAARAEILDTVWPDVHVTDDSITQCIVEIRRALGPEGALLKTVPKRGYLLEAPATPLPPAAAAPTLPVPRSMPVVAVMPFRLPMPDPALATFGLGVLEGVVGVLATLREPVVISANSTLPLAGLEMDPRAIGARLGASYVANGTLRRAGSRIRLSVELADARTAAVLWQRPFDIEDGDGFEAQDRIASVIANTLAPRVQEVELVRVRRARPSDMDAYHLLLEARQLIFRMERGAFEQAGALLRRAVELDADFAPAHAAIADWYSLRIFQGWSEDRARDAERLDAAIAATLARDASNPRALAMLGHNHTIISRRYDDALALFDRALESSPNDAEAWLWTGPTFAWMGNGAEAVRRAERAMALSPNDPLSFRQEHFRSIGHYVQEDHEAAVEWGLRSYRANPNYTSNLRMTMASLTALGRRDEAGVLARRHMELEPAFRVGPMIARQAMRDDDARERYGRRLVEAGLPA